MDSVLSVGYLDSVLAVDFSVMEQEQEQESCILGLKDPKVLWL